MTPQEQTKRECYSSDEENFNYDDFGDFLDSNDFQVGSTYWKADAIEIDHADIIDVEGLLENMDERLSDEVGEVADRDYSDVGAEAESELKTLIKEWATKHIKLRYWKVRNVQECKITAEDLT